MAVYEFSSLSNGQAIAFDPNNDVLNFDASVAAADLRISMEGVNARVTVLTGPQSGKTIVLQNTSQLQLASTNVTFQDGSRLLFGDNSTGTAGDGAANVLTGGSGNDLINGFGGADTLSGGLGNDRIVAGAGDVLSDAGGIDTVLAEVSWTLSNDFEHLTLIGSGNLSAAGNGADNHLIGNSGNNYFNPRSGNDTIEGGAGNDTIDMSTYGTPSFGNDVIDGGAGFDVVDYTTSSPPRSALSVDLAAGTITGGDEGGGGNTTVSNVERIVAWNFNDVLRGDALANTLEGLGGNDTLEGRGGNDTLVGGAGNDLFVFATAPGSGNVDRINDFASGTDKLSFDGSVFTALGAPGNFAAGDARFNAGAGFTSGRDASDRLVYDTSTGNLYYDADGNGAGGSILVATLAGNAPLTATDIQVVGSSGPAPIIGTEGNDVLTGTEGNDTIDGRGGNDWIRGLGGDDSLIGGAGDDTISGDLGDDIMDGGAGDDLFGMDSEETSGRHEGNDSINGGDGFDYIGFSTEGFSTTGAVTIDLATGIYSISGSEGTASGTAVSIERVQGSWFSDSMTGSEAANFLDGWGGNDSMRGAGGNDTLITYEGNDSLAGGTGNDTLTSGLGTDRLVYAEAPGSANADVVTDFSTGNDKLVLDGTVHGSSGPSGNFSVGDARFFAAAGATGGHDADDRLIYNTTTGDVFWDADGNGAGVAQRIATLEGAPTLAATDIEIVNGSASGGGTVVRGGAGNDSLTGTAGDDTLDGAGGADTMNGLQGHDTYFVTAGDVLVDSGGIDTVVAGISWSLGNDFENLTLVGTGNISAAGNGGNNHLIGNSGNNYFNPRSGNDTIEGGAGNDTIDMSTYGTPSFGNDVIDGGAGFDVVDYTTSSPPRSALSVDLAAGTITGGDEGGGGNTTVSNVERIVAWNFNDVLRGDALANTLEGLGGNDTLEGRGGNDTLVGGAGNDLFIFATAPGSGNVDRINDFASGTDKLAFDDGVFTALGARGNFTAGDARFNAGAGFTSGRDASDRLVYDTSTDSLYYDPDGSGSAGSQLIATFAGNPTLSATDITII